MPNFYIISGCNGAGKTTASVTILPEILHCREFVNADNIAAGISPWNVESAAFEAGRVMLRRIDELMTKGVDFAIETTLTTKSYVGLVKKAQRLSYDVILLFVWLESPEMAIDRVAARVRNGGHNIPSEVVYRRYYRGLQNLFELFMPICDEWIVTDNSHGEWQKIAACKQNESNIILNPELWAKIQRYKNE